jgi:mannose-6-phosphate isomerase-like protein (cupin superfamily)
MRTWSTATSSSTSGSAYVNDLLDVEAEGVALIGSIGRGQQLGEAGVCQGNTHPHEQAGYVVSGRYRQTIAGSSYELRPGDSYAIPGGIDHAMEVLEDGEVIDVFTPPRDEFR